jgi:hypothetical protein
VTNQLTALLMGFFEQPQVTEAQVMFFHWDEQMTDIRFIEAEWAVYEIEGTVATMEKRGYQFIGLRLKFTDGEVSSPMCQLGTDDGLRADILRLFDEFDHGLFDEGVEPSYVN